MSRFSAHEGERRRWLGTRLGKVGEGAAHHHANTLWHPMLFLGQPQRADLYLCMRGMAEAAEQALADVHTTLGEVASAILAISLLSAMALRPQSTMGRLQMESCQDFCGYAEWATALK